MIYNIFSGIAPMMPKPGKGTEICKLVLSQASKDMRETLVPMALPALAAHLTEVEFQYSDNKYYELCGQMGHLIGPSGIGKAQLTHLIEAIMRPFREHDETEYAKIAEWQRLVKTKGANKEKPERPDVALWFPPADMTNPAFLQNAMACEKLGGRTQYINLPEVEMADRMCGSHRQVSQMVRNIYDRQRAGALRATADGVTGNPILRVNLTISSTPFASRKFYRNELFNGTFGRMVFSFKPRTSRDGRIPRQGKYSDNFYQELDQYITRLDICKGRGERSGRIPRQGSYGEDFLAKLDSYLVRLDNCKGRFVVKPLNKLADQLAEEMAKLADLADDDVLWDVSKRAIVSAWKAGCILWVLNNQTWTKSMGDMVEWLVYHDIWSKMQIFADLLGNDADVTSEAQRRGPKNLLDNLPNTFNETQLEALRVSLNKSKEGTKNQLYKWVFRKFITYSAQTGLYTKTDEYLKGKNA